jgi:hydrogenase maturation protease
LVVGVGSDLRGDDAAGLRVAEVVAGWDLDRVTVRSVTQLVPELAEDMAAADLVIFVDAAADGSRVEVEAVSPVAPTVSSHHGSPAGLLALASRAGFEMPQTFVVTVPASDFTLGAPLSSGTERAVAGAAAAVRRLVELGGDGAPAPGTSPSG